MEPTLAEKRDLYTSMVRSRAFEETAGALGIPTNTAKTRYYRGLRKMRGWLGEGSGASAPKTSRVPEREERR